MPGFDRFMADAARLVAVFESFVAGKRYICADTWPFKKPISLVYGIFRMPSLQCVSL